MFIPMLPKPSKGIKGLESHKVVTASLEKGTKGKKVQKVRKEKLNKHIRISGNI